MNDHPFEKDLYMIGCVRTFNTGAGNVVSQDYPNYRPNTDCLIIIQKQPGTPLKLEFHDLNLPGDGDFVEVRQLGDDTSFVRGSYPGAVGIYI